MRGTPEAAHAQECQALPDPALVVDPPDEGLLRLALPVERSVVSLSRTPGGRMPCKPAEYDMREADAQKALAQLQDLLPARRTCQRLLYEWSTDPEVRLPPALLEAVGRSVARPVPTPPARPRSSEQLVFGGWALELAYLVLHQQRFLCEDRTLLFRLDREASHRPPGLEQEIDRQLAAHVAHRREDLEAARRAVTDALVWVEHVQDAKLREEKRRVLEEKRRGLYALELEDVLADRGTLEKLWP